MHAVLRRVAQVLRWMAVIASVAVFSVCQDSTSAPSFTSHFYNVELSTGRIISDTFVGTQLQGATTIASKGPAGWSLVGVANFGAQGLKGTVYSDASTGALGVIFYGGADGSELAGSRALATPGEGWSAEAIADLNGDGALGVIFVNQATGQVDLYSYGGLTGTSLLGRETISPLSASGWNVVGAADLNADGRPDLILQNPSTHQILVNYLGGPKGTTVTGTQELTGEFAGWTAAGMQDMNGDGHPDLILFNDVGQSKVRYLGGSLGVASLGESYLDAVTSPGSKTVVPTGSANDFQALARTPSVLVFNGTGTSLTDVAAIGSIVTSLGLAYKTINSSQLDGMTQAELANYKLFIVPGGDSIKIGRNLSSKATSTVRTAVQQNGLNYLGMCAGGFFGGFSKYNGLNLTSGVWFAFYSDYNKGIHKESVMVSRPGQSALDIYWQNGPELSNWGKVVGKYPTGKPAIVEGNWGNGFVILSGVHPEAPASWRTGMNFKTPLDVDLAYAATLVKAALNRTMLPHY
jgi:hypothetical protein